MKLRDAAFCVVLGSLMTSAEAAAPEASGLPMPRPVVAEGDADPEAAEIRLAAIRPVPRPGSTEEVAENEDSVAPVEATAAIAEGDTGPFAAVEAALVAEAAVTAVLGPQVEAAQAETRQEPIPGVERVATKTPDPRADFRPTARPEDEAPGVEVAMALAAPGRATLIALRPRARPAAAPAPEREAKPEPVVAEQPARVVLATSAAAVRLSPRPDVRPQNVRRRTVVRAAGVRTQPSTPLLKGRRGSVCGDRQIQGQTVSPIAGRIRGCGVSDPVRITSVAGVALTTPSTMDCVTAQALKHWVERSVKPTVGRLGGGVTSLKVAAHYSCRTRNNKKGAKISEHGKGRAIDISAINLKNGVSLTVLRGWRDKTQGPLLKAMHKGACGPFGTVLGPNADRYHQDHFHFDTARYRSGPYCR